MIPINPKVKTTTTPGKKGGGLYGQLGGAGLGALVGVLAAPATGGASLIPAAAAGLGGAAGGAGLGGLVGNAISPSRDAQTTQQISAQIPTIDLAMQSQKILSGLRALDNMPGLAQEYAQPLTQAYIHSMIQLKQRG
jgi:hypothetical protein